jgi:hypothetical protein
MSSTKREDGRVGAELNFALTLRFYHEATACLEDIMIT